MSTRTWSSGIYTLSLHDALPIYFDHQVERTRFRPLTSGQLSLKNALIFTFAQLLVAGLLLFAINPYSRWFALGLRSEEHTSELQSRPHLVCLLLLEKKEFFTPTA